MSYGYPQQPQGYPDQYHPDQYPPATSYAHDPYAQTHSYGDHHQPESYPYQGQGDYSHSDFVSPERDGNGIPGGRQQTYPPQASDLSLADKYGAGGYEHEAASTWEKPVPVTRGSIAAQVRPPGLPAPLAALPRLTRRPRARSSPPRARSPRRRACACSARTSTPARSPEEAVHGAAAASSAAP